MTSIVLLVNASNSLDDICFNKQVKRVDVETYEYSGKTAPPCIELIVTQVLNKIYTPPNLALLVKFAGIKQPDNVILKGAVCVSNNTCVHHIQQGKYS